MSQEIRRRRTDSPEIDAMIVIQQALDGLPEATIDRVLTWAMARYVPSSDEAYHRRTLRLTSETVQAFAKETLRLQEAAATVGLNEPQLIRVFRKLAEMAKDEEAVAP